MVVEVVLVLVVKGGNLPLKPGGALLIQGVSGDLHDHTPAAGIDHASHVRGDLNRVSSCEPALDPLLADLSVDGSQQSGCFTKLMQRLPDQRGHSGLAIGTGHRNCIKLFCRPALKSLCKPACQRPGVFNFENGCRKVCREQLFRNLLTDDHRRTLLQGVSDKDVVVGLISLYSDEQIAPVQQSGVLLQLAQTVWFRSENPYRLAE